MLLSGPCSLESKLSFLVEKSFCHGFLCGRISGERAGPLWRRDRRSNSKMVSRRFSQDLQTAHKIQGSPAIYSKRLQKRDPGTLQPCDRDPEPEPEKRLGLLMMSETSRSTSAKEMSLGPLELGGRAMANGIAGRWYMALIFNKAPIRLPWQPLHPDLVINSMESAEGRRCKKAGLRLDRQRSLLSSAPGLNSTPPRQWSWPAGRRPRLRRTRRKTLRRFELCSAPTCSGPSKDFVCSQSHLCTQKVRRTTDRSFAEPSLISPPKHEKGRVVGALQKNCSHQRLPGFGPSPTVPPETRARARFSILGLQHRIHLFLYVPEGSLSVMRFQGTVKFSQISELWGPASGALEQTCSRTAACPTCPKAGSLPSAAVKAKHARCPTCLRKDSLRSQEP